MTQPPEEIARRKARIASIRENSDKMFADIEREHQEKIASAIQKSVADAPAPVSVEEAQAMLKAFDEEER